MEKRRHTPADEGFWRQHRGDYLNTEELQQRLHMNTPQEIAELVAQKRILAVPTKKGPAYPAFQFDCEEGLSPTISQIIHIFSDVVAAPYTTASWLKGIRFEGKNIREWLESGGDPRQIIEAAKMAAAQLNR